ncbi:MAG: exodeoxyribonuclease VII large subunit, partial [Acidimicrobiales bacterium]
EMVPEPAVPLVRQISLAALAREVSLALGQLGRISVEGEVSKPMPAKSGWLYFTLRDGPVQINVACPKDRRSHVRAVDGERVLVSGTVNFFSARGQINLRADEVTPVGDGAIAAALAETRARLMAEGLCQRPRRPIPVLPRLIGVVCGNQAAVKADIASITESRFPGYPLVFAETLVSGPGAAEAITSTLMRILRRPGIDVVILARGGGSASELMAFSNEALCRAICASPVPVVSAIGHDEDRPLCDEVADLRCSTPSVAAAQVVPLEQALWSALDTHLGRAAEIVTAQAARSGDRLVRADPRAALSVALERADHGLARARSSFGPGLLSARLAGATNVLGRFNRREPWRHRSTMALADLAGRRLALDSLDPRNILARGYSLVRLPDGSYLRSPHEVSPGDRLVIEVAQGSVLAEVVGGKPGVVPSPSGLGQNRRP